MHDPPDKPAELSDELFDPTRLENPDKAALLAALLFTSGEVLEEKKLCEFLGLDSEALQVLAAEAAGTLRPQGLDILKAAGGYKIVTTSQWDSYVRLFHRHVRKSKLSKSALEVLAIIAYEQPITRARVDEIRQVSSESTVRTLLDRRLLTVAGRSPAPGRPFLYNTADQFLEVFGLESLDDLPPRPNYLEVIETNEAGLVEDQADETKGMDSLPEFGDELIVDEG